MKKETGLVDCKVCKGAGITLSDAQILMKSLKDGAFGKLILIILSIWFPYYFEILNELFDEIFVFSFGIMIIFGHKTFKHIDQWSFYILLCDLHFKWPPILAFWCNVKHLGMTYSHMKLEQKIMQIEVNRAILLVSSNKWYGPWALSLKFMPLKYIRF